MRTNVEATGDVVASASPKATIVAAPRRKSGKDKRPAAAVDADSSKKYLTKRR